MLLAVFNFIGLFPEYLSMRKIYYKTKELQHKPDPEGELEREGCRLLIVRA